MTETGVPSGEKLLQEHVNYNDTYMYLQSCVEVILELSYCSSDRHSRIAYRYM